MKVAGARILVAGGGRGLGRELALELARAGAHVAVSYRSSRAAAEATRAAIAALGREAAAVGGDLTQADEAARVVDAAGRALDGLDGLVYAASGPFAPMPPDELSEAAWQGSLDVTVKGFFFTAQAAYRRFLDNDPRHGVIVAITDAMGEKPWAAFAAHCAAKAAQIMLVRVLAKAWAADGVRVCGVAPGPIRLRDDPRSEATQRTAQRTVLKRLASPAEVGAAVRFCFEDDYVTGANLAVDGGMTVT